MAHDTVRKKLPGTLKILKTIAQRGSGLMFRWPKKPFFYWFVLPKAQRPVITMLWVFYPIDILFLEEDGTILEIKRNVKPFSHVQSTYKIRNLIEVPAGYVDANDIVAQDVITRNKKDIVFLRRVR